MKGSEKMAISIISAVWNGLIFRNSLIFLLCIFPIIDCANAEAQSSQNPALAATLKTAYEQYSQAVEKEDLKSARKHAIAAFDAAFELYGPQDLRTAKLNFNLGWIHYALNEQSAAAQKMIEVLPVFEREYGESAKELIAPLNILAKTGQEAEFGSDDIDKIYQRTLSIAEQQYGDDNIVTWQTWKEYGAYLYYKGPRSKARRLIRKASKKYRKNGLVDDLDYADLLVLDANLGSANRSTRLLLQALAIYEQQLPPKHPLLLATHLHIIQSYEVRRMRSAADKHVKYVAKYNFDDAGISRLPIFRVAPQYPREAQIRSIEGYVDIGFSIDENGYVVEPEVIDGQFAGIFKEAALACLDKWRYVPEFSEGEAVKSSGYEVRISFVLE